MKFLWFHLMKLYITIGLSFYYKKIIVKGLENVPKNKAVLFISNHPNALIDPLITATTCKRNTHYLTQAGAFNNAFVKKILFSARMIPVYRLRDKLGSKKLKLANEEIFQYCYKLLNQKKAILIFPEGSHNEQRRVRPFRKGFARIVFGAIDQNKDLEIDIIPVGVNYTNIETYADNVSIYYGKPIAVKPFWGLNDRNEGIRELLKTASEGLKQVTNHIEDLDNYDEIVKQFDKSEFLYPEKVNKKLETLDFNKPTQQIIKSKNHFNPLLLLVKINSFFPLLVWKYQQPKIKEREYIATFKYAVGITVFPLFYFIQTGIIYYFFGSTMACIYLIFSFLSVYILTKTKN